MKSAPNITKWVLTFAAVSLLPSHAFAEIAFQNFVNESDSALVWYGIGTVTNVAAAQRFTAHAGGVVNSISMILSPGETLTGLDLLPLIVEIRTVNNDQPGAILGSVIGTPSLPARHTLTTADFRPSNVPLAAGQDYFVVFRTSHGTGHTIVPYYYVQTVKQSSQSTGYHPVYSYDGGRDGSWYNVGPSPELGLIVSVVPEPANAVEFSVCVWIATFCFRRQPKARRR